MPDALSRHPTFQPSSTLNVLQEPAEVITESPILDDTSQERIDCELEWMKGLREALSGSPLTMPTKVQRRLRKSVIRQYWLDPEGEIRCCRYGFDVNSPDEDKYANSAPYIPVGFRRTLVKRLHDQYGHFSWSALQGILQPQGWWPGQDTDVKEVAKFCPRCQLTQNTKKKDT